MTNDIIKIKRSIRPNRALDQELEIRVTYDLIPTVNVNFYKIKFIRIPEFGDTCECVGVGRNFVVTMKINPLFLQ